MEKKVVHVLRMNLAGNKEGKFLLVFDISNKTLFL